MTDWQQAIHFYTETVAMAVPGGVSARTYAIPTENILTLVGKGLTLCCERRISGLRDSRLALQKEVDFEIADFFDRTAGVFLKELVELTAETHVIDDQCTHIQTAFMLHPQEQSARQAVVIFGFHQNADFTVDGLVAIPGPDPSRRPPIIELVDRENGVIAQLHGMILTGCCRLSMNFFHPEELHDQ